MKKRIWKIFKIVWFSLMAIFLVWMWSTFQSRNLPNGTLKSEGTIDVVTTKNEIVFTPKRNKQTTQVIFFPGGLADPKAYAPLCRRIAENGYTCHIIKMQFRLAQRDYKKISKMFDFRTGQYVIGGHSQGAKMAAKYVYENPGVLHGLFLMGTSHPRDIDLSVDSILTIKFYAENDGLASVDEVLENKNKLPKNTELFLIKGGNHSQFGYLGKLFGDDKAAISREEQQQIVFENLVIFLGKIESSSIKTNE
jgi:hypothetical protein